MVHEVCAVPVLDAEASGGFGDAVVDGFRELVLDVVEKVGERVGGAAVFGEEGLAEEGGVELGVGVLVGCVCRSTRVDVQ